LKSVCDDIRLVLFLIIFSELFRLEQGSHTFDKHTHIYVENREDLAAFEKTAETGGWVGEFDPSTMKRKARHVLERAHSVKLATEIKVRERLFRKAVVPSARIMVKS